MDNNKENPVDIVYQTTYLEDNEMSDVYNYLRDIDSPSLMKFFSITIAMIVLFSTRNIGLSAIVGALIGLSYSFILNEKDRAKEQSEKITLRKKLSEIRPQPLYCHKYPDIVNFLHSIKDFHNYNPFAFKKMVRNIDSFIRIHDDVLLGVQHCKHNYDIAIDKRDNALNHLHSILLTMEDSNVITKKLDHAIEFLHRLLNKYVENIVEKCKEDIEEKGLDNETGIIEENQPFPFNKYVTIKKYNRNAFTYNLY